MNLSHNNDAVNDALLQRIRGGDIAAYETAFKALHAPLCEVVDYHVRSQAVAEEIVQDLFFVIWLKRASLDVSSFRGYLFTAARNRALHHVRRQSLAVRWAHRFRIETTPHDPSPRADEALADEERRAQVRAAIDTLPPRTRLAFVLQWEHEMTNARSAEAMGISVKGVEKLLSTARRGLRDALGSEVKEPR